MNPTGPPSPAGRRRLSPRAGAEPSPRARKAGCRGSDNGVRAATTGRGNRKLNAALHLGEVRGVRLISTQRRLRCSAPGAVASSEELGVVAFDGPVFTRAEGQPVHPHALSQAFERLRPRRRVPAIRLHDLRHTHATLLIKQASHSRSSANASATPTPAFTMAAYQHVLPGMQADAAAISNASSRPRHRAARCGR